MAIKPPDIFARIYARHGHRCPMSTLGGRLGLAALMCLGAGTGALQAVYRVRTCALDGIAEATGCCEEDGTLAVTTEGRHALRLQRGDAFVELAVTMDTMQQAGVYRKLCDELERDWESLAGDEQQRRRGRMADALDALLPWLWNAADAELLEVVQSSQPMRLEGSDA